MADTIKSLADLLEAYKVGVPGNITAQDGRDFIVSAFGSYGSIRFGSEVPSSQTGIGTDFVKVNVFSETGPSSGVVPSSGSDNLTIDVDGVFEVGASISFGGSANVSFLFEIFRNGVATDILSRRKIGGTGDAGGITLYGHLSLNAGEALDLRVKTAASTDKQIDVYSAHLSVKRIG